MSTAIYYIQDGYLRTVDNNNYHSDDPVHFHVETIKYLTNILAFEYLELSYLARQYRYWEGRKLSLLLISHTNR